MLCCNVFVPLFVGEDRILIWIVRLQEYTELASFFIIFF